MVGCCLAVRVVSLSSLYLDTIHTSFLYLCRISHHSQDGLQNFERWCSFTCFSNAAVNLNLFIHDFYATEIKHLQTKSFVCFLYRSLLLVHLYKCLSNIDTCIYQKTYKCKNCLHKNLPLATFVCSLRIHFIEEKYVCISVDLYLLFFWRIFFNLEANILFVKSRFPHYLHVIICMCIVM